MTAPVVGVDFDNTIVGYDELLGRIAAEEGWPTAPGKRELRDRLRAVPDGERKWQRLQALAYGSRIAEAAPLPGALEFFSRCRGEGVTVHVVSHKTMHAAADQAVDLRLAAQGWLEAHGLWRDGAVHFEDTRADKLRRIEALGCTHFVDDLEETFLEPGFPAGVERILLGETAAEGVTACRTWDEVAERVLG